MRDTVRHLSDRWEGRNRTLHKDKKNRSDPTRWRSRTRNARGFLGGRGVAEKVEDSLPELFRRKSDAGGVIETPGNPPTKIRPMRSA